MVANKTKIYIQAMDGALRPILWFKSHNQNEILWSPCGMQSTNCTLRSLSSDEVIARDDISPRKYHFKDFIPINEPIDHFSSHVDGTFHLKGKHAPPIYSHTLRMREDLGINSPVFLEFIVHTEVAVDYRTENRLSRTDETVIISAENGGGVEILGAIAGQNYDIEGFIKDGLSHSWSPGSAFNIGNFKAALATRPIWPNSDLIESRPKGTLVTLRFLLKSGKFRHKTFLFN